MGLFSFLGGLRLLERFRLKFKTLLFFCFLFYFFKKNVTLHHFSKCNYEGELRRARCSRQRSPTWGSCELCISQSGLCFGSCCGVVLCCGFSFFRDSCSSFYPSFCLCLCSCSFSSWSLDFGSCCDFSFSWNCLPQTQHFGNHHSLAICLFSGK